MRQILSAKGIAFLSLVLLLAHARSYGQANTFSYLTWDDSHEWQAAVVKSFDQGDSVPHVRFLHSKVTRRGLKQAHYEDFISYISNTGEKWRATIHYKPGNGTFYFTHCREEGNVCHDDVIMNYRDCYGENRQLTIENCTPEQFRSDSEPVAVNSLPLHGRGLPGAGSSVCRNIVYINWKAGEQCGCSGAGGGRKHYLYNTTAATYRVTVQMTAYATPSHTATHDYVIVPGEELYIGCSESESQGCFSVDFAITGQVKLPSWKM